MESTDLRIKRRAICILIKQNTFIKAVFRLQRGKKVAGVLKRSDSVIDLQGVFTNAL